MPLKVERVWVAPEVLLYRNILSDNEMKRIKELALPRVFVIGYF